MTTFQGILNSTPKRYHLELLRADILVGGAHPTKLNIFPEIGRIVPEIGDPKIRELIIYSYRLIYEIFPDKIEILALIHGKRDFLKINLEDRK